MDNGSIDDKVVDITPMGFILRESKGRLSQKDLREARVFYATAGADYEKTIPRPFYWWMRPKAMQEYEGDKRRFQEGLTTEYIQAKVNNGIHR